MLGVIGSFAVAALVAYLTTPAVRHLAVGTGAWDKPDTGSGGRHIHTKPTPRLGGLAIFAGFTVAVGLGMYWAHLTAWPQLAGLWLGALIVAVVGVVDDYVDLPAKVKLAGQVLAAVTFV
ncbi:MAG TPA: undecaprenyl/decaprenyl-phosphate alpha-N-acetylglucosaminyl 1-phosphate transferase, partial [Firmicutes bacterium]|nr:undecaprenyl/decaprenyl-phosphate alpha-N-acetylglucosaminyl 1-phosphate transferase [Bacillota bacterium]